VKGPGQKRVLGGRTTNQQGRKNMIGPLKNRKAVKVRGGRDELEKAGRCGKRRSKGETTGTEAGGNQPPMRRNRREGSGVKYKNLLTKPSMNRPKREGGKNSVKPKKSRREAN